MKHLKKLISLTLALLMVFSLVSYQEVSAEDANALGHFYVEVVDGDADGWTTDSSTITITKSGTYNIEKACTCAEDYVHSSYSIVISGGITVNLTIEDIKIENTSGAAMDIDGSSTVTLTFVGDNSFTSAENYAGIQFNNAETLGGSLTITSDSEDNTLTATGGYRGSGIGGGAGANGSNITFNAGTVYAYSGNDAAAIGGGGNFNNSYGSAYNITINGGIIYAVSKYAGAGIGSGYRGLAHNITINGGTITAQGGNFGAGIGGGQEGTIGTITINGGTIIATGGYIATGIGGGTTYGRYVVNSNIEANIIITDGVVTATGGDFGNYGSIYSSAIGVGGDTSYNGVINITIEGGTIVAISADESVEAIGNSNTSSTTVNFSTNYANGYGVATSENEPYSCSESATVDESIYSGTAYFSISDSYAVTSCEVLNVSTITPETGESVESVIIVDTSTK